MPVWGQPDSPYRGLAELVAAARRAPGALRYGHQGIASIPHLAMAGLVQARGIEMVDVPYRGEPAAILDLIGGRVEFVNDEVYSTISMTSVLIGAQ